MFSGGIKRDQWHEMGQMFHFYTPEHRFGFLTFLGETEIENWAKMG